MTKRLFFLFPLLSLPLLGQPACPSTEVCDGLDNDGDGLVDEDFDADADGYLSAQECRDTLPAETLDCNDGNADVHPGASEWCGDGLDNDCVDGDATCTFAITGSYPTAGAVGVPLSTQLRFYFSEAYPGSTSKIHMQWKTYDGSYAGTTSTLSASGTYVSSGYLSLKPDTRYCARLDIDADPAVPASWPQSLEACFSTTVPCGSTVQLTADTSFVKFGGNNALGQQPAREALNAMLADYGGDLPVAMQFVGVPPSATFPLTGLQVALGEYLPGPPAAPNPSGWASTLNGCAISSTGQFTCSAASMVFPVPAGSLDLYMTLYDVSMSAAAISSGAFEDLNGYTMGGVMLSEDISLLADQAGVQELAALVVLDVDYNGDGKKDAASVQIVSEPVPLSLSGCAY